MKRAFYIGLSIFGLTLLFWLGYTITYLFIDGWHIKPISPLEEIFDDIVDILTTVAWMFIIYSGLRAIEFCIELKEEQDSGYKESLMELNILSKLVDIIQKSINSYEEKKKVVKTPRAKKKPEEPKE